MPKEKTHGEENDMKKWMFGVLAMLFLSGCGGYVVFGRPDFKPLLNQTVWYYDGATKQWVSGIVTDEFVMVRADVDQDRYPDHYVTVNGKTRDAEYVHFKVPVEKQP